MGHLLLFIVVIFILCYIGLILGVIGGWHQIPEWSIPDGYSPKTTVTVIVAARNEEQYIKRCIAAILNQKYPDHLLTIIVVNDQSTDSTASIVRSISDPRLTILDTVPPQQGKKSALSLAIEHATSDVILCTDADCLPPSEWLLHMVSYYESHEARLVLGPIVYEADGSLIQRFQYLDGAANMGITAAGIHYQKYYLANGANMLYERTLFSDLGGYQDDNLASGDDMMLVHKAALQSPDLVAYVKCKYATVQTRPVAEVTELIQQRKRWATKSKHYADNGIVAVQALVFLYTLLMIGCMLLAPLLGSVYLWAAIVLLVVKLSVDFIYLRLMSRYFGNIAALNSFLGASVFFIIYILWAGWSALFPSKYRWKGREVS